MICPRLLPVCSRSANRWLLRCPCRAAVRFRRRCTVDYAQKIDESNVSLFFGNERILQGPYVLGNTCWINFGIESSLEYETNLRGGEMDASFSMLDTAYTLENECTLTVSLSSPVEGESALNDSTPYFYYKTGSPDPFYVFNNYEGGVAENGIYFSLCVVRR